MARPKSEAKRNAIMGAATRVILTQGLSAPTAAIAHEAGISNGSLFTYFESKADLFNQLFLELKTEMVAAALEGFPNDADLRKQMLHAWSNWTHWATSNPEKRGTFMRLSTSVDITPATRAAGGQIMQRLDSLVEKVRSKGPLRNVEPGFVLSLMNALAEATMDSMIRDRAHAKKHSKIGFETFWRALT